MVNLLQREDFGPTAVDLERLVPDGSVLRVIFRTERPPFMGGGADYEVRAIWFGVDWLVKDSYSARVSGGEYSTGRGYEAYTVNITGWGPAVSVVDAKVAAGTLKRAIDLAEQLNKGWKPLPGSDVPS